MSVSRSICAGLAAGLLCLAGTATTAQADFVCEYVIDANAQTINGNAWQEGVNYWTTDQTANLSLGEFGAIVGLSAEEISELQRYYKQDYDNGESGPYQSSYATQFSGDPNNATITYTGGPMIPLGPLYVNVKDGNADPAQYIFDISDWNRECDLVLVNFWSGVNGAISHVELIGIPEPTSVAVWAGVGLVFGLGIYRRRKRRG
jgi:hypothetical protein